MTRVEVVNRQEIGGKEYKRGQVITVADGEARDLINAGKARVPVKAEKPAPESKEAVKNG